MMDEFEVVQIAGRGLDYTVPVASAIINDVLGIEVKGVHHDLSFWRLGRDFTVHRK
jgi:hypothetical protein